jgi:DNA-binding NarL/FixJ family response regulator
LVSTQTAAWWSSRRWPRTAPRIRRIVRVLIVDDSLGYPSLVRAWLRQRGGFDVVGTASSAAQGMQMLADLRPDVVILDLVLPDSPDPVERVAGLRAAHPEVRIVLVSSLQLEQLRHAGEATRADAVCHKGTTPEGLVSAIYGVLEDAGSDTQNRLP